MMAGWRVNGSANVSPRHSEPHQQVDVGVNQGAVKKHQLAGHTGGASNNRAMVELIVFRFRLFSSRRRTFSVGLLPPALLRFSSFVLPHVYFLVMLNIDG